MVSTKIQPDAAPGGVSIAWVGIFGYLCLCLHALLFSSLLAAAPLTFQALSREDYWVENLTAVWFLLAGFVLFVTTLVERRFFQRCVYVFGGMAMLFVAGEEISWGQRIFGFATPDFLMPLNEQKEFTVHNIANKSFDFIYLNSAMILCMVTSAAFFCRKDRLIGIPLPSILLMLGFLMVISYEPAANLREIQGSNFREYLVGVKRSLGFIVVEEKGLLLLFLVFTLFFGQMKLVAASAATLTLVLALTYVSYHSDVAGAYEVREYLFGLGCLFYCLEILLAQRRFAQSRVFHSPARSFRADGSLFLMTSCYLVIAGSIGMISVAYFAPAAIKEALLSVTADEPAARSDFDIYLRENAVIYLKSPCSAADVQAEFFLHVVPQDLADLPADRRQHGFGNVHFRYGEYDALDFGGQCIMEQLLPGYPIARIRTGQITPEGDPIWTAEFPVSPVESAPSPSTPAENTAQVR